MKPLRFEFATAARIVFGQGATKELPSITLSFGQRVLFVTGSDVGRSAPIRSLLESHGVQIVVFSVVGEPKITDVQEGAALAKTSRCDLVISFGGGSAIDCGKAIAAMISNKGNLLDYLEVIGKASPLTIPPVPFIAVPTTAGAGTEVTRNAVLSSPEHGFKVSLRSPLLLAKVALIDPELTRGLTPALTAATGLDALTQLIEPYTCCRPNPLTDALCEEGMARAARSLVRAFEQGSSMEAREDMCVASLFSGLALANAGLGAVHGFAAPLGGSFSAPHGAVCAALLPHVVRLNIAALQQREPQSPALVRYERMSRILTQNEHATLNDGICWLIKTCRNLKVLPLRSYGIKPEDFDALAEKAAQASSMKANPIMLTHEELAGILQNAW